MMHSRVPLLPGAVGLSNLKVYESAGPDGLKGGCPHVHFACTEAYLVLKGRGSVLTLGYGGFKETVLEPGGLVWFTPGVVHRLVNGDGELEILVIMQNAGLPEAGDCVLSFAPELLADPVAYREVANLPVKAGWDVAAEEAFAYRRRDLAVRGFNLLRARISDEGPSVLQQFHAAALRLIKPVIPNWHSIWERNAMEVARKTGETLSALGEGRTSSLRQSLVGSLSALGGVRQLRFCGRVHRYDLDGAVGWQGTPANFKGSQAGDPVVSSGGSL